MPWLSPVNYENDVRQLYSKLINCSWDCITFTPSTSYAMTLAAKNIKHSGIFARKRKVLVIADEMPSNVYPWQDLCSSTGGELCVINSRVVNSSSVPTPWHEAIIEALNDDIAVVALSNVHWCNGSFINLYEICQIIHSMDDPPFIVIDGTQSIGILEFDVQLLQPDFVACSVHKWLLGPYGTSLVYLNPKHHSTWEPLDFHDRTRLGSDSSYWDDYGTMRNETDPNIELQSKLGYPETFMKGAVRITAGGRPNPIFMPMLCESIRLVLRWGVRNLSNYLSSLTDTLADIISNKCQGFSVFPKHLRSNHILGVYVDSSTLHMSTTAVVDFLKSHNVHVALRHNVIRISPHVYNTMEDMISVGSLFEHLSKCISNVSSLTKVLIIGATGWLAQHLTKCLLSGPLSSSIELYATYRGKSPPVWLPADKCYNLDISAPYDFHSVIGHVLPDVIIHTAAVTSPIACDQNEDMADTVNCPTSLIDAVNLLVPNCIVVYTSTDFVYNGESGTIHLPSSPNHSTMNTPPPCTAYGRTKLKFEKEILKLKKGIILRLSNMIGPTHPYLGGKQLFLQWLKQCADRTEYITLKNDEIRSFVSVMDVITIISTIIEEAVHCNNNKTNVKYDSQQCDLWFTQRVYNVGGPKGLSRLDFAQILAHAMHISLEVCDNTPTPNTTGESRKWRVGSVASRDMSKNDGSSFSPPRDITMDSTLTENHFCMKFSSIDDTIYSMIHVAEL
jgi:selenocysteine lyase/cysteine desulfurase/dTDP-4-dehydrorhamnose reductase